MKRYNSEQTLDDAKSTVRSGPAADRDLAQLAQTFGTPLLVIEETVLRAQMRRFVSAFSADPVWRCKVAYAGKALLLQAIARIAHTEGLLIDVCSEGELQTVLQARVPPSTCLLHGCAKSEAELTLGVRAGVRYVVVDHAAEIQALAEIAAAEGKSCPVLVRVNPGIAAATKAKIQTGAPSSKFGFSIEDGQALAAVLNVRRSAALRFDGLHCHLGSQISDLSAYEDEMAALAGFASQLFERHKIPCPVLNLGGGVAANGADASGVAPEQWAERIFASARAHLGHPVMPLPSLMVEPGRAIVSAAGTTLYRVMVVKTLGDGGQALIVDGGMSDNPRPALYDAAYAVSLVREPDPRRPSRRYTVFGRHCETDLLFPDVTLPEAQAGDLLAVQHTGAYTYSMASNYNRFPRPAVVLWSKDEARLIALREPLQHLLDLDVADPEMSAR